MATRSPLPQRETLDARERIAGIDWGTVAPPNPEDSGMSDADGHRMTQSDIDAWLTSRLQARGVA